MLSAALRGGNAEHPGSSPEIRQLCLESERVLQVPYLNTPR